MCDRPFVAIFSRFRFLPHKTRDGDGSGRPRFGLRHTKSDNKTSFAILAIAVTLALDRRESCSARVNGLCESWRTAKHRHVMLHRHLHALPARSRTRTSRSCVEPDMLDVWRRRVGMFAIESNEPAEHTRATASAAGVQPARSSHPALKIDPSIIITHSNDAVCGSC